MLRALFCLGVASALALSLIAARSAPPMPGPGAVIEMHEKLFGALDRGDTASAMGFVAEDGAVSLLVLGADGGRRAADGAGEMRKLLSEMADQRAKQGGKFETKITKSKADCDSERLSWGYFELETTHTVGDKKITTNYAMTSIVRWTREGMRLVHGHLSAINLNSK
jgi:hypothetical protein